jgi:hypothetical protein
MPHEAATPCASIDEQTVIVSVVLLDKLSELVGLLCVVERIQVHNLVPRPFHVSNCLTHECAQNELTWADLGRFPSSLEL